MASRSPSISSVDVTSRSSFASWSEQALSAGPPTPRAKADATRTPIETNPSGDDTTSLELLSIAPFSLDLLEQEWPRTPTPLNPRKFAASTPKKSPQRPSPAQPAKVEPAAVLPAMVAASAKGEPAFGHKGYLNGISLSAILQMLHMEQNSCTLEITAAGRLGTLTIVNGVVIDAEVNDECGDTVAMQILRWPNPTTLILPSGSLVRHSVTRPLTQLLMDAVRLEDEAILLPGDPSRIASSGPATPARWTSLPATIVALGATVALVMTAADDEPVASAGTSGDRFAATSIVARGVRTWSSLLIDGVDRVHVVAGNRRLVLAALTDHRDAFIYLELPADQPLGAIWQAIADAG